MLRSKRGKVRKPRAQRWQKTKATMEWLLLIAQVAFFLVQFHAA